ncbi:MAG: DUF4229 domain-containing protein [Streptosporangiales bacterium]|nr:DUF4229 domain-containing protein [Streptosporangiales bacterium]MBO0892636.1 DUF4229 domain-containing protein [Acidothermales bacterium]
MRAFVQYTAARIALFLACWGILWLVGAKGVLGVLLGLVVSGLISYVVLDKVRARFADQASGRIRNSLRDFRARFAAGKAAEDEPDDEPDPHARRAGPG